MRCDLGHHVEDCVHKRGLARPGGSNRQNVLFRRNGGADDFGMAAAPNILDKAVPLPEAVQRIVLTAKNSCLLILRQGKYSLRTQPYCEYGTPHDGRNDAFEATAIERKFRFENRTLMIHNGSFPRCNGVQRTCRLSRRHRTNSSKAFSHSLDPQRG